jgi:predicted GH43/DUF377 family glycosyl hydrolase
MSARKIGFAVDKIEPVKLDADALLRERQLMSPYVWRRNDGHLHMLVRAVPQPWDHDNITGRIWHGVSDDGGAAFKMEERPLIVPGPGDFDVLGCEDPTVVNTGDGLVVYYTGLDAKGDAQMLYAAGRDIHHLEKKGMVFQSSTTEDNTKEATIERTKDGEWRLFYEFARNDASLIGLAVGAGPAGPWGEHSEPFAPRPDHWDSWHLSTGPLLANDQDTPIMFYNGATREPAWRIGWVAFSRDCKTVIARCDEPLITPPRPDPRAERDIAFAASLLAEEGKIVLYFSIHDRALFRAFIARV